MAVFFADGREVVVANAKVERQARPDFPIVDHETGPHVLPEVGAEVAVLDGGGLRPAQQEIGEIETCSCHRQALRIQRARSLARKVERAASILIGLRIQIAALELHAPGEGVDAPGSDHAVAQVWP